MFKYQDKFRDREVFKKVMIKCIVKKLWPYPEWLYKRDKEDLEAYKKQHPEFTGSAQLVIEATDTSDEVVSYHLEDELNIIFEEFVKELELEYKKD